MFFRRMMAMVQAGENRGDRLSAFVKISGYGNEHEGNSNYANKAWNYKHLSEERLLTNKCTRQNQRAVISA